ncbi:MAG: tetratricopeptide repeat-containing protein kinase family protein [Pirellulaceae bacterium]
MGGGLWFGKAVEQDNVTWTGDIVGTIGYMAPERFQGQTDERSDIYGLGLTLYELVTFQRAFEGRDRVSVMQKVTSHQLAAPRKRNPGIPKDLETIILKATAADPNDRYQTAEELADDLDAFLEDRPIKARRMPLTEQLVRWCRKNKAVAGLTAAVAALLIAISVSTSVGFMQQVEQRRQADEQRRQAEEMRRQSDQFVDEAVNVLERIYGQFSPNATAMMSASTIEPDEDSGMFDTHDSMPISKDVAFVLENLLSFYDDLSQRSSDATSVLVKSVMANRRVGDIHYRLGDLSSARSAYERAIERFGSLPEETRSNPTMNVELARVYNGLGTVVRWNGERGKAIEAHETALQHLESVLKPDQSVRYEVAHTHFLLYHALHNPFQRRRGRAERDEAEAREQHLQLAIHQLEQLLASEPTSAESQFLLARCVAERGQQLRWRDWRQPEMNDFEKNAVDRLTQLMERFPHMPDYPFELANVYLQVFHSISRYGSPQRDEENKCVRCQEDLLKTALDVTKNLDRRHPNIPRFMHQQVDIQRHLGRVYAASGDWPKAETAYLAALDQARNIIDEFGDERGFQSSRLHDIQLDRAQTLVALEDHDTAISILKSSIEFFEGRRETFSQNPYPDNRRWAEGRLKHAYPLLSTSLRATGDENGADEVLCKARNLR